MLSVGVVSGGGIGYYLHTVGSGVDDYYVRAEPGRWYGRGAGLLGAGGEVGVGELQAVLETSHPGAHGSRAGKVAAYDLTFSSPKSVSVLAELCPDPAVRAAAVDAHRRAVADALSLIETEAARGRRGHGGARSVEVVGVAAAGFDHHTSRAGDPQLHTHLLVLNRACGVDGRWGALDGRRLFGWAKTAGYTYQASLRHHLTTTLGVAWGPVSHGAAEISGLDPAVLAAFSTRRAQITTALEQTGFEGGRAAQIAALATRPAKPDLIDPDHQRLIWSARARDAGLAPDALIGLVGAGRLVASIDVDRLTGRLVGPTGLTAKRSSFDQRAVIESVCAAAGDGLRPDQLRHHVNAILAAPGFMVTGHPGRLAGPTWTTVELAQTEARILTTLSRRRSEQAATCPPGAIDAALAERGGLADEQTVMVRQICRSGDGIEIVVGPAGTGKTFALDTARAAWANSGVPVVGAALAARTARALEAGTGIPSTTIDQILNDASRPGLRVSPVLPWRGVLVVDEAGMVGTRKLDRLLQLAGESHTKVVLVGDPRQLPEIEAGGALGYLADHSPVIELTANRRQSEAWERDALGQLRTGNSTTAVSALGAHGRITLAPTADQARERLVADWATTQLQHQPSLMVALTREDVDDLNRRARHRLETLGVLDPARDRLHVGDTTFGVGETVIALRNDRRAGILNGTTGLITAVDLGAGTVSIRPDQHAEVTIPADYLVAGHLTHGWAVTIYKAQGVTTQRAFLLGTDRLYREAGYVALSRATTRTDWYHVAPETPTWNARLPPERELARLVRRSQAQQLATKPPPPSLTPTRNVTETRALPPGPPADRGVRQAIVLADPGTHLIDALGPPPLAGPQRATWAKAAVAIDDYRRLAGHSGSDPLGRRPIDAGHRQLWDRARLGLTQARVQLHLDRDRDLGLDR